MSTIWRTPRFGGRTLVALASASLLAAGSVAAYLGARSVAHSDTRAARLSFHLSSAGVASTLQLAIQHEEDLVVSASAFIAQNPQASAQAFDRWAETVRAMQRYPELENIGLVVLVPASRLAQFEARMRAHPLLPLGVDAPATREPFQVLPAGRRATYCFAVAGMARDTSSYIPEGLDYCALAKPLLSSRDTGQSSYAPFVAAHTTLGVETPVYRGGRVPATVAARHRSFLGWLGELLVPEVVLQRALQGHTVTAAIFRYQSGATRFAFTAGRRMRGAQVALTNLHNGWTVQTFGPPAAGGVLADGNAQVMFFGGLLVSLLVASLVFVLGTGRTRAMAMVREKTRELSHQAMHDALTGLPNRALVLDRARQMLSRAARSGELIAGALYIDVDGFKHVNDNLGHAAGDELLRIVGERLQGAVREHDTVGRLGGDEFVVLVETNSHEIPLEVLANRLIEVLRRPARLGERSFSFTASVGVAAGRYATPDELLRDADLALYAAKAAGRDRYAVYDASMSAGAGADAQLELALSNALWEGQLFVDYQPIFDLSNDRVVTAEALVRWRHPERGLIPPDAFIPLAERSGLIVPLGRWVLRQACAEVARWRAEGSSMRVSVNVSASQLAREGFTSDVRMALLEYFLEPSALTLEVTETAVMRDVTVACERLEELKLLGVSVAIDDFGTGYASLAHLQRMPADILKVDRSFVAALDDRGESRGLLEAILGVARALSLSVVAEGVENAAQLAVVRSLGCEMAQGYLLGRPGPAAALGEHVRGGRLPASTANTA